MSKNQNFNLKICFKNNQPCCLYPVSDEGLATKIAYLLQENDPQNIKNIEILKDKEVKDE